MVVLVFVMILCVALAVAVMLAVAVPARREGRGLLTPHGEEVVARVKERTESVTSATRGRTEGLVTAVKDKVGSNGQPEHADATEPQAESATATSSGGETERKSAP